MCVYKCVCFVSSCICNFRTTGLCILPSRGCAQTVPRAANLGWMNNIPLKFSVSCSAQNSTTTKTAREIFSAVEEEGKKRRGGYSLGIQSMHQNVKKHGGKIHLPGVVSECFPLFGSSGIAGV